MLGWKLWKEASHNQTVIDMHRRHYKHPRAKNLAMRMNCSKAQQSFCVSWTAVKLCRTTSSTEIEMLCGAAVLVRTYIAALVSRAILLCIFFRRKLIDIAVGPRSAYRNQTTQPGNGPAWLFTEPRRNTQGSSQNPFFRTKQVQKISGNGQGATTVCTSSVVVYLL